MKKLKKGEKYWVIDSNYSCSAGFYEVEWHGCDSDLINLKFGNCFKTLKEAENFYKSLSKKIK
jgi:hypothetical protein